VLQIVEERVAEDEPLPKNQVRVRVLAAGVTLPDVMARDGTNPETPQVPFTLVGMVEQLEVVVAVEVVVTGRFQAGKRVAGMPVHGSYTEYITIDKRALVPAPTRLDPQRQSVVC